MGFLSFCAREVIAENRGTRMHAKQMQKLRAASAGTADNSHRQRERRTEGFKETSNPPEVAIVPGKSVLYARPFAVKKNGVRVDPVSTNTLKKFF